MGAFSDVADSWNKGLCAGTCIPGVTISAEPLFSLLLYDKLSYSPQVGNALWVEQDRCDPGDTQGSSGMRSGKSQAMCGSSSSSGSVSSLLWGCLHPQNEGWVGLKQP